ncbi:MAG: VCBS repeat-containing protein [Planctomycetes bacterium]|nr:VCBS repeat-containing protein [Planctomycetota bacterium]
MFIAPATAQQVIRTHVSPSTTGSYYGYAMASGDIDKDGVEDLVTGDWSANPAFVHVISGATGQEMRSPVGNNPMHWTAIISPTPTSTSYMGRSLSIHPDIDDDTYPDIVVGCPDTHSIPGTPWSGSIRIFSGRDGTELPGILNVQWRSLGDGDLCFVDANLDGKQDIVAGVVVPGSGTVVVYSGNAPHDEICAVSAGATHHNFGASVDVISDLNGDGVPELVVGKPCELGTWLNGSIYVVSVGPQQRGQVLAQRTSTSTYTPTPPSLIADRYGWNVVAVPDRNGDGKRDILVSATYGVPPRVELISGDIAGASQATPLWQYPTSIATSPVIPAGGTIVPFVDIDNDGVEDFFTSNSICSGVNGAALVTLQPDILDPHPFPFTHLGFSETGTGYLRLGDYNSDGLPEIAVVSDFPGPIFVVSLTASTSVYGLGCGAPPLNLSFSSLPRILGTGQGALQCGLSNGPANGLGIFLVGLSRQLPALPLGAIAPGCSLLVQPTDFLPIPIVSGSASWSYAWPAVPQAHGREFFAQALTYDGQFLLLSNPGSFRPGL